MSPRFLANANLLHCDALRLQAHGGGAAEHAADHVELLVEGITEELANVAQGPSSAPALRRLGASIFSPFFSPRFQLGFGRKEMERQSNASEQGAGRNRGGGGRG